MKQVKPFLRQVVCRPAAPRTPGNRFTGVRRLLVVRHDRLGDFLLTIPAIAALRETYRDALLGVMVSPAVAPVAGFVPGVDEVLETDVRRKVLVQRLADFNPDLIVCISRGAVIPRHAWRQGITHRVGSGRRFYSPLFTRRVGIGAASGGCHEVEFALSFAHRCGASPGPARFPIVLTGGAIEAADNWLDRKGVSKPFVVLHPGSGGSCPSWPVDRYIRLATGLAGEGIKVVLTLGPLDAALRKSIEAVCGAGGGIVSFSGELPVLSAVLNRSALVVSNSTGPLHLAMALGTPTLAIHAPWSSCSVERWGPYSETGWALVAESATAQRWSRRERKRAGSELLGAIPPGLVQRCVLEMLAKRRPTIER